MIEPTTANEYSALGAPTFPIADGTQVAIWMTSYAQTQMPGTQTYVSATGQAVMVDLTHYDRFAATNYVSATGSVTVGGDVFTVRTWPKVFGESLPPGCTIGSYQKIALQTADGQYIASDSSGFYHATPIEAQAAVFLMTVTPPNPARMVTLYPTFYTYGERDQWDALLDTLTEVGTYSVQFVQPVRYFSVMQQGRPVFGNITAVPESSGPVLMQQVQGTPPSSLLFFNAMQQTCGLTMPFGNGQRLMDSDYNKYLAYDGELRPIPNDNVAQNLFTTPMPIPYSPLQSPADLYLMGPPLSLDARLVNVAGAAEVWFVNDEVRRWVSSGAVMALYDFDWANVQTISEQQLSAIPMGPPLGMALNYMPYRNGTRVTETSSGKCYLVIDEQLRWIPNPATYDNLFANWAGVLSAPLLSPTLYTVGPPLTDGAYLAADPLDPKTYLLVDGVKRWVASPAAMARFGFDPAKVQTVLPATLEIPEGADIDF